MHTSGGDRARRRCAMAAADAHAATLARADVACGAAVQEGPFGTTLTNGKYGENYNPKVSIVKYALGGAAALPTNPTQKNIALAAMFRAGKTVDEDLAFECWQKNICETGTDG